MIPAADGLVVLLPLKNSSSDSCTSFPDHAMPVTENCVQSHSCSAALGWLGEPIGHVGLGENMQAWPTQSEGAGPTALPTKTQVSTYREA